MAIKGYGVQVSVSPDVSKIQEKLNKKKLSIKIKNIKISDSLLDGAQNKVQSALDKKSYEIKINKAVISQACKKDIQDQLTNLYKFEPQKNTGDTGSGKGRAKTPNATWQTQKSSLDSLYRNLNSSYNNILNYSTSHIGTEGSAERLAAEKEIAATQDQIYQKLIKINSVKNAGVELSDAEFQALRNETIELTKKEKTLGKDYLMPKDVDIDKLDKYYKTLHNWLETNSKAKGTKEGNVISDALTKIENASLSGGMKGHDFKIIQQEVSQAQKDIVKFGNTGKSTFDKIHAAVEKFGGWTIITQTVSAAIRYIKNMSKVVTELDTAMTSLKKVTDETDHAYEKFAKRAEKTAISVGATVSQYITSTADYARLGYSLTDAEELARVSALYANVGDNIDENSATESIISTMKAFDLSADEAADIVDKFNKVGNEFAIGSDGLGEVLKRSASAMHAAQNDLDETIALSTAMNTVLQDPEKVGTTIKTVSMFLRAAKVEAEEAGESTEGMAQSVSKLRADILQLTDKKVDIMIDDNTYKNTYQILQEISKVWDSLTDVDRASLLEMLGGKRNANAVAAVIENFEIAEQALLSSQNAAGSAMIENEKYLNSVAGSSERLTAAQQSLTSTLLDSDVLVFWNKLLTGVIQVSDAVLSFGDGSVAAITLTTTAVFGLAAAWGVLSKAIETSRRAQDMLNGAKSMFNPKVLAIAAAAAAIVGLIKGIQWLSQATERARDKYNESIDSYTEIKQQIASINSELETTQSRISELGAKTGLTIIEQKELDKLKETNAQLLRQKDLLDADAQAGLNKAQVDFIEYMKASSSNLDMLNRYIDDAEAGLGDFYNAANHSDAIDFLLHQIEEVDKEMESILPGSSIFSGGYSGINTSPENALREGEITQDEYDRLRELIRLREKYYSLDTLYSSKEASWNKYVGQYKTVLNEYLDVQSKLLSEVDYSQLTTEGKAFVDTIDDMHYKVLLASGNINDLNTVFSAVFFSDRFKLAREDIENFGDGTKLTAENIESLASNSKEVKELLTYLEELGLINFDDDDWAEQTANQFNVIDETSTNIDRSLKKLEEYSKELDDIRSAFNSVKSVIEDYNKNGGHLSVENYQTLVNLGSEYLQCLVDENGQIKLNTQAYANLTKVQMQNMLLSKIQASIDNIMGGSAEDAAKLATIANYDEADSLKTLIEAKLADAYATAQQKDAENNTTAYTDALRAQLPYWSSLVSFYDEACKGLDKYGLSSYDAADALDKLTDSLQKQNKEREKAKSDIQRLIDLTVDMIKQEKEDEKEAYEKQKEQALDLIEKRKELLDTKKEEIELNKKLSEQQNSVAQNALSASLASLDDSSAGRKASKLAQDALTDSKSDLGTTLSDYEYDTRTKALDRLKESTESYYDSLIAEIDKYLKDERKLYEDACTLIDKDNGALYNNLKKYVYDHTTMTEGEFDHMWNSAQEGLRKYDDAHTPLWETMSTLDSNILATKDTLDELSSLANESVNKATAAIGKWDSAFQSMLDSWNKVKNEISEPPPQKSDTPKWKVQIGNETFASYMTNRNDAFTDILDQALNSNSRRGMSFGELYEAISNGLIPYDMGGVNSGVYMAGNAIANGINRYASGTLSAAGGLSIVGEDGPELRVTKPGDGVIPAGITENLWNFGLNPEGAVENILTRLFAIDILGKSWGSNYLSPVAPTAGMSVSAPVSISISGNANKETVDELKRLTPQIAKEAAKKVMESALRYSSVPRKY